MPIIKSAIKRAKQAVVRRERNMATKKNIKSTVKAFLAKPTSETLSEAQSTIDTAVKKRVLNKQTAARRKSALSKIAKEANVKLAKKPAAKKASPAPTKKAATAKKATTTKAAPAKKAATTKNTTAKTTSKAKKTTTK